MTKRLVDMDDDLLERARSLLGASTMKETVNRALEELVAADLRRCLVVQLVALDGLDLDDDEVMSGAWR
jgi:Arc/MetJ family transcription regulator